jgi:hypothetical protein
VSELDDFDRSTPLTGLPNLDFAKYGDQWLGLVARYLADKAGISSHTTYGGPGSAAVLMRPRGGSLSSGLLIVVNGPAEVSLFVLSSSGAENDAPVWAEAAVWAFEKVGKQKSYDCWAVVSQNPESPTFPPLRLADRLVLNGIAVEPAGFYREFITPRSQMLTRIPSVSQLVVVKLKGNADDLYDANRWAAGQARRLTGLLSVAFGSPWVLRMGPNPGKPGEGFVLPDAPKHQTGADQIEFPPPRDAAYPDWIKGAWKIMARKPWLSRLVVAFQEGLLLGQNHESYAAMAFVAIIEEIGTRRVKKLPRCTAGLRQSLVIMAR